MRDVYVGAACKPQNTIYVMGATGKCLIKKKLVARKEKQGWTKHREEGTDIWL